MSLLWTLLPLALAQDPGGLPNPGATPPADGQGALAEPPEGPPRTDAAEVHTLTLQIGRGLRCPVCQGLSVADSQSDAAVAMKDRIQELVGLGYGEQQIVDFFVSRYGTWVLLEPPREGLNTLIFVGPGALVLGGLALWALRARPTPPPPSPTPPAPEDPYRQRVLDELERE